MTAMGAARVLALAGSLALLGAASPAGAGVVLRDVDTSGYPTLRVTVVSSAGAAVRPVLTENGVGVVGLRAENLGRSKSLVLAVDRSQSMAGASLAAAREAASAFLSGKPAGDRIGVLAFGSKATQLSGFSTATIDADSALRTLAVDATEGTALYDAVVLASGALAQQQLPGRVLILLTDGRDVSSRATLGEAIEAARRAGVVVYPIGIESRDFERAPLERLAGATGGRYYGAASPEALATIYSSIAAELGHVWRISYATAARPGDPIRLRASVAGAGWARRSLTIPGAGAGSERSGRPTLRLPVFPGRSGAVVLAIVVGLLVLLAARFFLAAFRRPQLRARIAPYVGQATTRRPPRRRGAAGRSTALAALFRATERAFSHHRLWRHLGRRLERADIPLRTVELVYVSVGVSLLAGLLAAAVSPSPPLVLAAAALGGCAPYMFVASRVRRRLAAFEAQLPDVLVTMAAALKAGHSFHQGIQAAVDEDHPPASDEFRRVLTEAGLGRPVEAALNDMAARVGSKNFEFVITAVAIQRQIGGSLAGLIDLVADTVRQRQQAARKIRSLTAMGRMSAYVLLGLPLVIAAAISLLSPDYMSPLYHTGSGHILLGVGIAMMCVGALILKKIVSFGG